MSVRTILRRKNELKEEEQTLAGPIPKGRRISSQTQSRSTRKGLVLDLENHLVETMLQ